MKKKGRYDLGIKEERGPQAQRGVDIHKHFEEAITNGTPLPPEFQHYDDYVGRLRSAGALSELKLGVTRTWDPVPYEDPNAWIIAIIDLWAVQGVQGTGIDWKTGKIYYDHIKQKEFYSCVLAAHYPKVNVFSFWNVYLDLNDRLEDIFGREEIEKTLRPRWTSRIEMMERDTECAPTPNFFCRWCAVSKRKGGPCPF